MRFRVFFLAASFLVPSIAIAQICPPGKHGPGGNAPCQDCAAGTFSSPGSAGCTTCPDGYVAASTGSATCSQCPNGTTSNPDHTQCVAAVESAPSGWGNVLLGALFLATALTVLGRQSQA
jgi:hypothetical protein